MEITIVPPTDRRLDSYAQLEDILTRGGEFVLKYNGVEYSLIQPKVANDEELHSVMVAVWNELPFDKLGDFIVMDKPIKALWRISNVAYRSDKMQQEAPDLLDGEANETDKRFKSFDELLELLKHGGNVVLEYNGIDVCLNPHIRENEEKPVFVSVADLHELAYQDVGDVLVCDRSIREIASESEVIFASSLL